MKASEKIVLNTGILYVKLVVTIIVNLIATRLILNAMGVVDYGVVNLISGIVSMLTFVQNSMAISTQRYMSVNIGKGDASAQEKIFNNGLFLHLLLGLVLLVLLEACLPLVFNSDIQIPSDRYVPSVILYQLTCLGTFLVVICVPIDATLNAHENMLWVSYASILESIIRLVGAYWLLYYNNDKLIFYGFLIVAIRLSSLLLKTIYCKYKYSEVKVKWSDFDVKLMKGMLSFSVWNMFGAFAIAARGQGVAIILNIFEGVIVNSAYGIGQQVSGQLSNFSGTISKSMSPQIMQREGGGKQDAMISLALKQCLYTTVIMFIFALPLYLEMPYVLQLWLKTTPKYAIEFCKIFLLISIVGQMSSGLMTAIQAKGKIAGYQMLMSILILLNLPVTYWLLKEGLSPAIVLWSMLGIEVVCLIARIYSAKLLADLSIIKYVKGVVLKLLVIILPTAIITIAVKYTICANFSSLAQLITCVFTSLVFTTLTTFLIMDKNERAIIESFYIKFLSFRQKYNRG